MLTCLKFENANLQIILCLYFYVLFDIINLNDNGFFELIIHIIAKTVEMNEK